VKQKVTAKERDNDDRSCIILCGNVSYIMWWHTLCHNLMLFISYHYVYQCVLYCVWMHFTSCGYVFYVMVWCTLYCALMCLMSHYDVPYIAWWCTLLCAGYCVWWCVLYCVVMHLISCGDVYILWSDMSYLMS
jgi:hypothetical protein